MSTVVTILDNKKLLKTQSPDDDGYLQDLVKYKNTATFGVTKATSIHDVPLDENGEPLTPEEQKKYDWTIQNNTGTTKKNS